MQILPETPDDEDEVEYLFDLCFAPGRQGLSSYQLREGVKPVAALCEVVRDETGALIGAIRYWPVMAGGAVALLLGPVAVHPTAQGEGIAAELIHGTLAKARGLGWQAAVLIGDAPYYARFGFARDVVAGLEFPPPVNVERFLGLEFEMGYLSKRTGIVEKYTK